MRIITHKRLKEHWEKQFRGDSEEPLKAWNSVCERAQWSSPNEVKQDYGNASILGNNRVVFNVGGNKYRLVVAIDYKTKFVLIKFVGTHREYDAIDAETYEP